MPPPGSKGPHAPPGSKGPREKTEKTGKNVSGASQSEKCKKGEQAKEPLRPGWVLSQESLAALLPMQRRRHLLFCDLLEDAGAAASIFTRDSVELPYSMPDPLNWTQTLELPAERQNRLLGVLKAAEARARVRALRLRYTRMRAEEIALLIRRQGSARAAIRLELFLPPHLKPTKIQDPLDRQERRRVETILEEAVDGSSFRR